MIQNHHFPEIHGNFGFGCMRLPMKGEQVDLEQFTQMVDIFLDAGFNYFDTAHGYLGTQSETALRECLVKRYPRDRFILTDKLSTHFFKKEEEVRPLLDLELEACGVKPDMIRFSVGIEDIKDILGDIENALKVV